ncbi:MAG: hypothetical protein AAFV93_20605 [Chloroflexota bacterium]
MMRWIGLFFFLICVLPVTAQTDSIAETWEIVERCISETVVASDSVGWEGMIAFYDTDGIHAIRPELDKPYFLAFDNTSQFFRYSSISRDGQWLMIPSGTSSLTNLGDTPYRIDELHIYSTGVSPQLELTIPWQLNVRSQNVVYTTEWSGNNYFVLSQGFANTGNLYQVTINDDKNYEIMPVSSSEIELYDNRLALLEANNTGNSEADWIYQIVNGHVIDDSFKNLELSSTDNYLAIIENEVIVDKITSEDELSNVGRFPNASPDGRYLAFSADMPDVADNHLYILDIEEQIIIDTCVDHSRIVWSWDSQYFMFATRVVDSQPNIINIDSMTQTLLPYWFTGTIIGWYPS